MKKTTAILLCTFMLLITLAVDWVAAANIASATEEMKEGDIVRFGANDWRVLEIKDGRALLLSDGILTETNAYNGSYTDVTWETCTLREYLNGEFYNSFSADEKARISETGLTNDNNQWYGTSGGAATVDKIFLLNLEEVVKYFGDSGQLMNRPDNTEDIDDQYNSARIAHNDEGAASWHWLRSPGANSSSAAVVFHNGKVNVIGNDVHFNRGGVRPALWIYLQERV